MAFTGSTLYFGTRPVPAGFNEFGFDDTPQAANWTTSITFSTQGEYLIKPLTHNNNAETGWGEIENNWQVILADMHAGPTDRERIIPAGSWVWNFTLRGNRLVGTAASVRFYVLKFTPATNGYVSLGNNLLTNEATLSLDAPADVTRLHNVAEIRLKPTETLMFFGRVSSTGGGLGGDQNIDFLVGQHTDVTGTYSSRLTLPGPIRTIYFKNPVVNALANAVLGRRSVFKRVLAQSRGVAAMTRTINGFRRFVTTGVGAAASSKNIRLLRSVSMQATAAVRKAVLLKAVPVYMTGLAAAPVKRVLKTITVSATGSAAMQRVFTGYRSFALAAVGQPLFKRAFIGVRKFSTNMRGTSRGRIEVPMERLPFGEGVVTVIKKIIQVFDD